MCCICLDVCRQRVDNTFGMGVRHVPATIAAVVNFLELGDRPSRRDHLRAYRGEIRDWCSDFIGPVNGLEMYVSLEH